MAIDVNATLPLIGPLVSSVNYLVNIIQWLVGGIFGIYIILLILRWKEARKLSKILEEIRSEVKKINKRLSKNENRNKKGSTK